MALASFSRAAKLSPAPHHGAYRRRATLGGKAPRKRLALLVLSRATSAKGVAALHHNVSPGNHGGSGACGGSGAGNGGCPCRPTSFDDEGGSSEGARGGAAGALLALGAAAFNSIASPMLLSAASGGDDASPSAASAPAPLRALSVAMALMLAQGVWAAAAPASAHADALIPSPTAYLAAPTYASGGTHSGTAAGGSMIINGRRRGSRRVAVRSAGAAAGMGSMGLSEEERGLWLPRQFHVREYVYVR